MQDAKLLSPSRTSAAISSCASSIPATSLAFAALVPVLLAIAVPRPVLPIPFAIAVAIPSRVETGVAWIVGSARGGRGRGGGRRERDRGALRSSGLFRLGANLLQFG